MERGIVITAHGSLFVLSPLSYQVLKVYPRNVTAWEAFKLDLHTCLFEHS